MTLRYEGIVTVSGDGLIHEIINGLLQREDKYYERRRIPIGALPGGSANGLTTTLTHESGEFNGVEQAGFLVIKGQSKNIDVIRYDLDALDKPVYSFLCFFWAVPSDVDLESEKIRWAGAIRFQLWSVWRSLSLRKYSGMFKYCGQEILNENDEVKKIQELDAFKYFPSKEESKESNPEDAGEQNSTAFGLRI